MELFEIFQYLIIVIIVAFVGFLIWRFTKTERFDIFWHEIVKNQSRFCAELYVPEGKTYAYLSRRFLEYSAETQFRWGRETYDMPTKDKVPYMKYRGHEVFAYLVGEAKPKDYIGQGSASDVPDSRTEKEIISNKVVAFQMAQRRGMQWLTIGLVLGICVCGGLLAYVYSMNSALAVSNGYLSVQNDNMTADNTMYKTWFALNGVPLPVRIGNETYFVMVTISSMHTQALSPENMSQYVWH